MRNQILSFLVFLLLVGVSTGQSSLRDDEGAGFGGLSHQELVRRITDAEQKTLAQFSKHEPILETYAQSLDPQLASGSAIDDVYFLGRVSLDVDSPHVGQLQRFAFGATKKSRSIKMNTGDHWRLNPDAEVDMLFVDVSDFDASFYDFKFEGTETLGDTESLRVSVSPVNPKKPGRFVGKIWVETSGFHIVRIQGTYTPKQVSSLIYYFNPTGISSASIYFHFDSYRQEVSPGVWMPANTYFEEARAWNAERVHLTTSFRFRGIASAWGYVADPPGARQAEAVSLNDSWQQLLSSGLIASTGDVEQMLNSIVREIQISNNILGPAIDCRVLLTTPAEIFSLDHTVLVSRGLLNLVPDRSVLAVLLAREVAHITLGHSQRSGKAKTPIFESLRSSDFAGLGLGHTLAEDTAATARMLQLLQGNRYAQTVSSANQFLSLVAAQAPYVPHLLQSAFGASLPKPVGDAGSSTSPSATNQTSELQVRGDYKIDCWKNKVMMSGASEARPSPLLSATQ